MLCSIECFLINRMLAYPTPTFDAKTIRSAPGFRPLGKAGATIPCDEPVAETPMVVVNRHTKNGGFVGSRARNFIQNNQFLNEKYDPEKGTPLSKVGSVGNVGDQFISAGRPYMAEPKNEELRLIMNILDGKPIAEEQKDKLTAKQVRAMGEKSEKLNVRPSGEMGIIDDIRDAQDAMKKTNRIRNAMAQGFTFEEANKAYEKLREREAETALFRQQDVSIRLYDVIDSRVGGNQNPLAPGNDESALGLARNENRALVLRSVNRNDKMDKEVRFDAKQVTAFQSRKVPSGMRPMGAIDEFLRTGKPIVVPKPQQPLAIADKQEEIIEIETDLTKAIRTGGKLPGGLRRVGGRPKGRKDVEPRVRRTKAELGK
jgi:hypothetical protein